MKNSKINIAILGASGYTGAELIRFLHLHPNANITALTAESQAGQPICEVYPHLASANLPDLVKIDEVDFSGIDLVFCCLPHGTTQPIIASLPESIKIIDLSADFRLNNTKTYKEWYGHDHQATDLQKQAVYGLSELARGEIANARLVANPGCYPTSALLPLIPLIKAKTISTETIIIDSKSGITGAGRAAKRSLNFCETSEGMSAYGVGNHRHMPEIEQELSNVAVDGVLVNFTPNLIPMRRGMLTSIYVKLTENNKLKDAINTLKQTYNNEYFVHILEGNKTPSTHHVRGSNHCHINIFAGRRDDEITIISAIDNLVKGASGQAVQNMNIMFDLPENTALENIAVFP